jgi:hypothetical protein
MQEVVKASHLEIRCGPYEAGMKSLEMIPENQRLDPDPFLSLGSCFPESYVLMQLLEQRRLLQEQASFGEASLVNLLYITRPSTAADPRDKIFALYSLLTNSAERGATTIDYGMETKRLYQNVTESLISWGRPEIALLISIILHALVDAVQRLLYHFPPEPGEQFSLLRDERTPDGLTKTGKGGCRIISKFDTKG